MKISLDWLKEYINIEESAEKISELLTQTGLEVEGLATVQKVKGGLVGLVIGEVLEREKHPNADTLSITKVAVGNDIILPIVCGAPNVAKGQKVVVATVGATLYPTSGDGFKIKKGKIRGEQSLGMICAEDEIGLGTEHDGILVLNTDLPNGTPAAEYFNLKDDYIFEIGLTPNRADGASHFGTARDLKAALGRPTKFPNIENFKVNNTENTISVSVENTESCPRYSGLTISGIEVKPSPEWLQDRLKAIGLAPLNNVVDATNYILHGLGQPLHAFDTDKITDKKIVVKTLPQDTKFLTLDDKEIKLSSQDLMICDGKENPMCIGGVFGGLNSGVSENTTSIFLESAYFSPASIRRSSMIHSFKTDAAFRFERGTDPNICIDALKAAALLIQGVAGGKISSEIVDIYPNPISNFEFEVTYKNIKRLIGKELEKDLIKTILTSLDIVVSKETAIGFHVSVPPYRVDVTREADIIEEILRIYGFNNVELDAHLAADYLAEFPKVDKDKIRYEMCQFLAARGASEIITNSITKSEYAEKLPNNATESTVKILNYLSADLTVMRQSLIFSGLEVVAHNINRKQKELSLFEFGTTYQTAEKGYDEQTKLAFFVSGNKTNESWVAKNSKADFHSLSIHVIQVLQQLKVVNIKSEPTENELFVYGLDYKIKNKVVATMGLLKPKFPKELKIKQDVFYAEIDWDLALESIQQKSFFQELSKFPEVRRDLSLVMDKSTTFDQIEKLALSREKHILKAINVFDIYEGEKVGEGKKSYSISLTLQEQNKTLTDKVIDKTMKKLMFAFEKELNILIRK